MVPRPLVAGFHHLELVSRMVPSWPSHRGERGGRYYRPNCPRLAERLPTTTSITRERLRKTLLGWSAPAVTICKRCRVLKQQVASGSNIIRARAGGGRHGERAR